MKISSVLTRLACLNKVSTYLPTYLNFRGVSARLIFQEIEIGRFARAGKETAMKMAFNGRRDTDYYFLLWITDQRVKTNQYLSPFKPENLRVERVFI